MLPFSIFFLFILTTATGVQFSPHEALHYQVAKHIFQGYNNGYIPKRVFDKAIKVNFSMELYQIIEINEPQQYMIINSWIVERWVDNLIGWDPEDFSNITEIMVPFEKLWIPDTTLYNSLVMDDHSTKRLLSAKLRTKGANRGALVELLYPTIFKQSCMLDLRIFPFDLQKCRLTFGSWTYDNTLIDYFPHYEHVAIGTSNCIENEGWLVVATEVERIERKYNCCPNNYTLLEFHIFVQRKPLYYIISLIIPTSIITFISIIGFFSSPSINDLREEKISLGITTLLSMSILVFMVSDKIPSTSSFILIGIVMNRTLGDTVITIAKATNIYQIMSWFYTSMILLISFGTIASSFVIFVQKKGLIGDFPPQKVMKYAQIIAKFVHLEMPLLMKEAYARKAMEEKMRKSQLSKKRRNLWYKIIDAAKEQQAKETDQEPSEGKKSSIRNYYSSSGNCVIPVEDSSSNKLREERNSIDSTADLTTSNLRNLAQLEFDWLAAVVERIFLIVFVILFFITSVGINLLGFFMWQTAREIGKTNNE